LTPRRSQSPVEILLNWAQQVLRRKLFEWIPALGRALNVPLSAAFAGDFADRTLEDQIELVALSPDDLDPAMTVLRPAMRNDAGDVSTYPQGASRLRSLLLRIDHCTVTGHTMMVLDRSRARVLTRETGPVDWEKAQPLRLKPRLAPPGVCYTLTCQGDFALFFRQDVLPLLHFLEKYAPQIGPLHIVTRPDFPGFVMETLRAISDGPIFLEAGGQLIRDSAGEIVGAIGVTGDVNEVDDLCAMAGIRAAGFLCDDDFSEADCRRLNIKKDAPIRDPR